MADVAVGTASGKIILFGEHAVVYGVPAIAVPVRGVAAEARVKLAPPGSGLTIRALDLDRTIRLTVAPEDDPLAAITRLALVHMKAAPPDAVITIRSTIPIASGLGSGTAVSTAIVRGLAAFFGAEMSPDTISELVFEVEKLHHGTPSGIDNTVIAYGKPVFFVKGSQAQVFNVASSISLLIGDTGVASPTKVAVRDVRLAREREPARFDRLFLQIGQLASEARTLIERGGRLNRLGEAMDDNHALLQEIGVSCDALELLVTAARKAGALGAKLSGGGRGGNMIALAPVGAQEHIAGALRRAGAVRVIETVVGASSRESGP